MRIILASSSPRRKFLLKALGHDLTIIAPHVDETPFRDEAPEQLVRRLSRQKADAVGQEQELPVIAADTIVVLQNEILGKPDDDDHARAMLRKLSGKEHSVLTGYMVKKNNKHEGGVVHTRVWFRELSEEEINWYVLSKEPLDKAGAYAIQELGASLIDRIEGSYTNVIGLPLKEVSESLNAAVAHDTK